MRLWVCLVKRVLCFFFLYTGEEPTESLFMKELKRRGMTPTSLLEETNRGNYGVEDEMKIGEEDRGFSKRNPVSTELDKSLSNQREKSMALNSEGIEVSFVSLLFVYYFLKFVLLFVYLSKYCLNFLLIKPCQNLSSNHGRIFCCVYFLTYI